MKESLCVFVLVYGRSDSPTGDPMIRIVVKAREYAYSLPLETAL
jgi:hypothetical protein